MGSRNDRRALRVLTGHGMYALVLSGLPVALTLATSRTHGLAVAGGLVGAYIVAAATGGLGWARLTARTGPARALRAGAAGVMATGVALCAALAAGAGGTVLFTCMVLLGLTRPQVSAAAAHVLATAGDQRARQRALTVQATVTEAACLIAPAAVALTLGLAPTAFVVATLLVLLAGSAVVVAQDAAPADPPLEDGTHQGTGDGPRERRPRGRRARLGGTGLALGAVIGAWDLVLIARAQQSNHPGMAGWLVSASVAGSLVLGLVFTARPLPGSAVSRLRLGLLVSTATTVPVALTSSPALLLLAAAVAGAPMSAVLAAQSGAVREVVPGAGAHDFTVQSALVAAGTGAGSALAGALCAATGSAPAVLAVAAVCLLAAALTPHNDRPRPAQAAAGERTDLTLARGEHGASDSVR